MTAARRIRWLRVTLFALLGVLAALTLAVTYLLTSPDALKPVAAFYTKQYTGYDLQITGPLETTIELQPTITARRVALGNADWAVSDTIATAEFIKLRINLPALLDRQIDILELDVVKATGALEVTEDGVSNLDFLLPGDSLAAPTPADRRWKFLIQGLQLDGVEITALIGTIPLMTLEIFEVVEVTDPASHLTFVGRGELNDNAWRLAGDVGRQVHAATLRTAHHGNAPMRNGFDLRSAPIVVLAPWPE